MSSAPDSTVVWDTLRAIPDPEFGVNIVDLGLIYSVECSDGAVAVTMTLTTPNCPSGGWIYEGAKEALERLDGVKSVSVTMVFDPPWSPEMLSETARSQLGRGE
ncbi:MAG TPA: iron-sulfur cluster assembly protein [Opitutaceae bacterium]|nr:iron-sulfur cluster assembly protein [Opitutaceae bacterium]